MIDYPIIITNQETSQQLQALDTCSRMESTPSTSPNLAIQIKASQTEE